MTEKNDVKTTGKEMLIGILFYGLIVQLILLFFQDWLYYSVGLWVGTAIAAVSSIHMRISLEDAMDLGEKGASAHSRSRFLLRYLITAVVLGIVLYFRLGSILTILIGITGLKIAAYSQPVIHNVLKKFRR